MSKAAFVSIGVVLALSCGPQAGEGADEPPGALEFERPNDHRIYRMGRRVDILIEEEHGVRRECGILTDRALADIESTIARLDPKVDYGYEASALECGHPGAWVHIEGFEHSPFECSWECCRLELMPAAVAYLMIITNVFYATPIEVDGEPYVAIEPDRECE